MIAFFFPPLCYCFFKFKLDGQDRCGVPGGGVGDHSGRHRASAYNAEARA